VLGLRLPTEQGLSRRDMRKVSPPLTKNPKQSLRRCRRPWLRCTMGKICTITWA